jgi:hypothetical protein
MKKIILTLAFALASTSAMAQGLYYNPYAGAWRAVPPPHCCSCPGAAPCGYYSPPAAYYLPPAAYYASRPDPGAFIAGAIVGGIVGSQFARAALLRSEVVMDETYLGDGVYCSFDGSQIWLRAPRSEGDHVVALEPQVYAEFVRYAIRNGFPEVTK